MDENLPQETSTIKLCIKCKHIATSGLDWHHYRCMAPQNSAGINYVTGTPVFKLVFCEQQREGNSSEICGTQGKWFEEAPIKVPFATSIPPVNGQTLVNGPLSKKKLSVDDL